ncbi:hypothetical protein HL033_00240 [Neoehrlichia mikurensis]|nr:hypothetical protein [Neoehrlichia mikurensis]QXK93701.1 hypothetical protein HL033_00240 [Neoehrlichia mikurensis]UTO55326.1 hypothetical protein LUA82_04040 [Neoehrlichia mikurensis]
MVKTTLIIVAVVFVLIILCMAVYMIVKNKNNLENRCSKLSDIDINYFSIKGLVKEDNSDKEKYELTYKNTYDFVFNSNTTY